MVLPYNKWTDEQIKNRNVVPDGDYSFRIKKVELKKSKGGFDKDGNPKPIYDMLELEFDFHDETGVVHSLRDWIVFSEGMDWKLRHLANTTGLLERYDDDTLDVPHLRDKTGVFTLSSKEFDSKEGKKRGNYVKDYVKKPDSSQPASEPDFYNDVKF